MTDASKPGLDQAKVDAFTEQMLGALNSAGLALMSSIGHRTGLFDAMAAMAPATSEEIARSAGLNERYVREWLGAMTAGRIIEYDPQTGRYRLPSEHAARLTRSARPNNMAQTMQWVAVLGQVEDQIVDCFRRGGGVHYSAYARFHEVMAEESAQTVVAALLEGILPLVPGLIDALKRGIDVLDVGCGAGRALLRLAEAFPASRFLGCDISAEAVAAGNEQAKSRKLPNARFEIRDVANLGMHSNLDLITAFDAIHDQAKPAQVLREIAAALRPSGTFLMQDINASSHLEQNLAHPVGAFLYTVSCMHCMTVSLAQGGAGLGTCWGEELACQMLRDAGFEEIAVHRLPHDIQNSYFVARVMEK